MLMCAPGGLYLYHNWEEEPVRTKVCTLSARSLALCHTHTQREIAVAHSGAAWTRLKDAFTLSSVDTPVEVADSGSSLGHKVKVGWNNGASSKCRFAQISSNFFLRRQELSRCGAGAV